MGFPQAKGFEQITLWYPRMGHTQAKGFELIFAE
jgi:hypothetical protein